MIGHLMPPAIPDYQGVMEYAIILACAVALLLFFIFSAYFVFKKGKK